MATSRYTEGLVEGWTPHMTREEMGPITKGMKWHLMPPNTFDDTDIRTLSKYN